VQPMCVPVQPVCLPQPAHHTPMAPKLSMKACTKGLCCTARRQRFAKSVLEIASFCSASVGGWVACAADSSATCVVLCLLLLLQVQVWSMPEQCGSCHTAADVRQGRAGHSPHTTTRPTRPTVTAMKPMGRPKQKYVNCCGVSF
jgi:hypothetical protein